MKLIIRCDDVNYFTKPEELEILFKDIWDKVPINLAVIPYVHAMGNETPLNKRRDGKFFIDENKKLVKYLRKKIKQGKVNIWQHGVTHKNKGKKFECESPPYNFYPGKVILQQTFQTDIKVFVAPHDRFSKEAIKQIETLKMDICRAFSPLPRELMFRKEYFESFVTLGFLYLSTRTRFRWPPGWMDYGGHKELYSYRIGHIKDPDLILEIHKGKTLCITVHHRSMNTHDLETLKYIVERCNNVRRKSHKKRVPKQSKEYIKKRAR